MQAHGPSLAWILSYCGCSPHPASLLPPSLPLTSDLKPCCVRMYLFVHACVCGPPDAPEAAPLSPMHAPSERPAQRKDEVEPGTWTAALFSPVLKFFGTEEGACPCCAWHAHVCACACVRVVAGVAVCWWLRGGGGHQGAR